MLVLLKFLSYVNGFCYLSQIKQGDVDFHQYYSNGKLEELKNRMDRKEYPPRCKATVVAKHKNFFVYQFLQSRAQTCTHLQLICSLINVISGNE